MRHGVSPTPHPLLELINIFVSPFFKKLKALYIDALTYFFTKMYEVTNLWPTFFVTASSLSLASLLFNGRLPGSKGRRRLYFPLLSEPIFDYITENMLSGGFGQSNCFYVKSNNGFVNEPNLREPGHSTTTLSEETVDGKKAVTSCDYSGQT